MKAVVSVHWLTVCRFCESVKGPAPPARAPLSLGILKTVVRHSKLLWFLGEKLLHRHQQVNVMTSRWNIHGIWLAIFMG